MNRFWDNIRLNFVEYYDYILLMLPDLIVGLVVLFLFWLGSKYLLKLLKHTLERHLEDQLIIRFIVKTIRIVLWGISILIFMKMIGWGSIAAGIWGTAGIGAFVIGFAFKDIGEHFLAGFILAFNRPFRVGDIVEMSGYTGTVVGLNLRNTHIKSFDGKDVYIPNGSIIKSPLVNYTIDGFIRKDFSVSIGFDEDQDKAESAILNVLRDHPDVIQIEKTPNVFFDGMSSRGVRLKAVYWLDTFDETISSIKIEKELVRDIVSALRAGGMHSTDEAIIVRSETIGQ